MYEYKLTSSLLISNANQLLEEYTKYIQKDGSIILDLADASNIDSAGIAFLVELKALSKERNCKISFINISAPVVTFAKLYQLNL